MKGYYSKTRNENGKYSIVFNKKESEGVSVQLPCGQCIGCRLERSRQWAVRCMHEASLYKDNCFLTLTFNNDNLNSDGSLVKRDFVLFMKRLRKKFGSKIRFFHCGEYGSKLSRPHHHACIFNFDFPDKVLWTVRDGIKLYRSKSLEKLWPYGFCTIGSVTFESAAYVARYITKKITGKKAESHYEKINKETGEVVKIVPEYITMSRRPGIARAWFEKFKDDVYPSDFVIIRNNIKCKPPKYYDKIYDEMTLDETNGYRVITGYKEFDYINLTTSSKMRKIKMERKCRASAHTYDNTFDRLRVREEIQSTRSEKLIRGYEK